jgi:opacity protein-like surface antigen
MKTILFAAAVAMASIGVASAQDSAQEEPKPEKKICRTDKSTGSLTRRTRICMTEAQWRELNGRTRKGLEEMGQSGAGGTNSAWQPSTNGPGPGS